MEAKSGYTCLRLVRNDNGVAEVVLCRPEKLNSMIPEFWAEVGAVFAEIDKGFFTVPKHF